MGDIGLQNDGKIVVGGSFTTFNGTAAERILRLNSDGSRDGSFSIGLGPNGSVGCLLVTPERKVYISGNFALFDGIQRLRIARLTSSGSLDTSFDPQAGLDGLAYTMALQPDGNLLIGGNFINYNNVPVGRIARILPSGQPDPTFIPGTGVPTINQNINSISLQQDGKIIVAGLFTSFNNQPLRHIVRLLPNGQLDANFNPPVFSDQIESVVSLPNGKIALAGRFTSGSSIARNRVAGLNSDGTMDLNFNPGTGANGITYLVTPYGSNKLMIGGYFTSYNGTSRGRIARINAESFTDLPAFEDRMKIGSIKWFNQTGRLQVIPFGNENYQLHLMDIQGRMLSSQSANGEKEFDFALLKSGVYLIILDNGNHKQFCKLLKE